MRYIPFIFFATPALAHEGAHLHPHGFEALLAFGVVAALVYAAVRR